MFANLLSNESGGAKVSKNREGEMRKPVGITVVGNFTIVLCDDGTVWYSGNPISGGWKQAPAIPGTMAHAIE